MGQQTQFMWSCLCLALQPVLIPGSGQPRAGSPQTPACIPHLLPTPPAVSATQPCSGEKLGGQVKRAQQPFSAQS